MSTQAKLPSTAFPPHPLSSVGEVSSGISKPYWYETQGRQKNAEIPDKYPKLIADVTSDVCVIGGGIAGLTQSYLLAKNGKKVVLLEDGLIASGESGRTTAHIFNALDDRYMRISKKMGKDAAKQIAESQTAAMNMIESIVREENIDCDFLRLDGYLFPAGDWTESDLKKEFEAAKEAGLNVSLVDRAPDFDTGLAIKFPNQGQFHMNKYLVGLAQACERMGVQIFTRTHAKEVKGSKTGEATVTSMEGHKVNCKFIVEATNVPINDTVTMWTKMKGYRSYVIAAKIPKGTINALYWDTYDPYHYVRMTPGSDGVHDSIIIGGEDHPTGAAHNFEERYENLFQWAKKRFPLMGEVTNKWSGQVTEPFDGVAFLGKNPGDYDNVFIITGDSGMGMTNTTLGAMINTDLILGRPNPWADLHSPSRQTIRHDFTETVMENIETQYHLKDWFKSSEVADIEDIKPGCGAILQNGLSKAAVYRDEEGKYHSHTAVCPHLGGILNWNDSEKSWDCPLHGSRFSPCGFPMNGPTNRPLHPVELKKIPAEMRAK